VGSKRARENSVDVPVVCKKLAESTSTEAKTSPAHSPITTRAAALFSQTSVVVFEALCSMGKDDASCVVVTPRAGEDFGSVQIKTVDDDQVTQIQLVALLQQLLTGVLKPVKAQRHVENIIHVCGLTKRLSCFNRDALEVMLMEFLSWVIFSVGDTNFRITRKSMFSKLKAFYGWKVNILKKSIETVFDNLVKAAEYVPESNTTVSLGKQELLVIMRRLVEGNVKVADIVVHKKVLKLFL